MGFPAQRPRRIRNIAGLRDLARESALSVKDLILPLFVKEGINEKAEIPSMPGVYQLTVHDAIEEAKEISGLGIPAVILFGIPKRKDETASPSLGKAGIIQRTIDGIRNKVPEIVVIADVCCCQYMSHGHCGAVRETTRGLKVDNDCTLALLSKIALSYTDAGADVVAPSDMMDGRVAAIRSALDEEGRYEVAIMSYAAKYASSFYGPFREAVDCAPKFGDRSSYLMDYCNSREAIKEVRLDIEEGADIVIIKPSLAYGDIISKVRERFDVPVAAFNAGGEYSMVKAGAEKGWLDEKDAALEILYSLKRAGADIIITYWAKEAAKWLR